MDSVKQLKTCVWIDEIYDAIDTNDMGLIVRTAMNVLIKAKHLPHDCGDAKSKTKSVMHRNTGNDFYKAGINRSALVYYNMALAYAPKDSEETMLAYANRSAVLFNIRYFTSCQTNAKTALSMGCPNYLAKKLKKRIYDTTNYIQEELFFELKTSNLFTSSYFHQFKFDCKRNADVPSVIADVTFVNENGAKRPTARKGIEAGTVVAIERAFASCVAAENRYLTCHYCHLMNPSLHPCDGCSQALFCDKECKDRCMKEYHRIECQIMEYLSHIYETPLNALVTKAAIKISLEMGWDALITASENIGVSRMRTATVRQTYNSEEPLSILSYDDDKQIIEGRIFNGSIICATILHCLDKAPDYFPKETIKREAAKTSMSRIMLHLYVTFTNTIPILCSSYDFNSKAFKCGVQTNYGWFSMSSKLKHSCEPNLMLVGLNDSVSLVALRTIKKGEELTISYIEHFYDFKIVHTCAEHAHLRAMRIFQSVRYICECRVCMNDWDSTTDFPVDMTNRQYALFKKLKVQKDRYESESFNDACAALNEFPVHSTQHKFAYVIIRSIIHLIQCKQTNNKSYL